MPDSANNLNYSIEGEGRPVVFLHGFLEDLTIWKKIKTDHSRKILIDLPGHGKSQAVSYKTITDLASGIIDLLVGLQITDYDVVGHSLGGYVALELKAQDPDCEKVVLLNSNFWEDSKEKKLDRIRVARMVENKKDLFVVEAIPGLFYDPEKYDKIVKQLVKSARKMSSTAIAAASLAMMARIDHTQLLRDYPKDIFIIQGTNDTLISPDQMKKQIQGLEINYYELPSSHMSWAEIPEKLTELLNKLLQ